MIGTRRRGPASERQGSERAERSALGPFLVLLSVLFVFGVVRPFLVEPFYVPSESMEPTLAPGDRVLATKFTYRFSEPQRGELVVFESPGQTNEVFIKRVVGLPGETVSIWDGVLFVNGEPWQEPYVDHRLTDSTFFGPQTVPQDHVFVMGDNRSNSRDSRDLGAIPREALLGEVSLRLWPLDRAGPLQVVRPRR